MMAEPLWPGGPCLYTDPLNKPKSKRFNRLDQAHAALGIKVITYCSVTFSAFSK